MTFKTIAIKGRGIQKEAPAAATITPGYLLERATDGDFQAHSTAAGLANSFFAKEYELEGKGIDDDYTIGEQVIAEVFQPGAEIFALVAAAAPAIVIGDALESAGDGTLRKQVAGGSGDGLYDIGTLTISATADQFKTTTTAIYKLDAVQYSKAATDNLEFTAADTINTAAVATALFGIWRVQINAAGTVSTKPGGGLSDQVYTSAALALAALPDVDADNVSLGYITVASPTSTAFTANTTNLTTIGAFVDSATLTAFPTFQSAVATALEAVDNSGGGSEARIQVEVL